MRGRSRRWPRLPEHLKSWNERCISARQPSSQRWRTSAAQSRRLATADTFAAAALKHVPLCLLARALLRHFTKTTCHISHIPVSTSASRPNDFDFSTLRFSASSRSFVPLLSSYLPECRSCRLSFHLYSRGRNTSKAAAALQSKLSTMAVPPRWAGGFQLVKATKRQIARQWVEKNRMK